MDAFELLKADHKKVAELFDQLESAHGKAKLDVFKQIKSELELHAHIEEKIFYPALEKPEETHDLTLEAYEEHKVVKTLLAELAGATAANDEWQAKAKVLRENVEHHVDEEENELFDKADDALSDEEIEALGERMETEKARKLGQPTVKPSKAKTARSSKAQAGKPGILARLVDFVGLGGGDAANKRTAKKPSKKTGAQKASQAGGKAAAKKKARKATSATAGKRSLASQGLKRTGSARSSGAGKRSVAAKSPGGAGKTAAKKRKAGK